MPTYQESGYTYESPGVAYNASDPTCPTTLAITGVTTPDDWQAYDGDSTISDKIGAVAVLGDTKFIQSTGLNTEQWFTMEDIKSPPSSTISKVTVTTCAKRADPNVDASIKVMIGDGTDTYAVGFHPVRCGYSCVTTNFYTPTPWSKFDPPWAWSDINNFQFGISADAGTPDFKNYPHSGDVDVGKIYVKIWCDEWEPCPRCCCCCLCFAPKVTWSGITFDEFTFSGGVIDTDAIVEQPVPYVSTVPGINEGCYFDYVYDPPLVIGSNGTTFLTLGEISITSSIITPETVTCSDVYFAINVVDQATSIGLGSFVVHYATDLKCCDPHHLSTSSSPTFSNAWTCGVEVTDCGSVRIECLDGSSTIKLNSLCEEIPPE